MPKLVDHEERRAAIAWAACEAIADFGLDATTLSDISGRAGCATGAVLHYFPSKEEVILAALGHLTARAAERIIARERDEPSNLMVRLVETLPLDDERRLEWRVWIAFWGRAAHDHRLSVAQEVRYDSWHRSLVRTLGVTDWARHLDAVATANELMALVDGIGVQALLNPSYWTAERQRDAVASQLRRLAAAPDLGSALRPGSTRSST